jgi:hypothetical protein
VEEGDGVRFKSTGLWIGLDEVLHILIHPISVPHPIDLVVEGGQRGRSLTGSGPGIVCRTDNSSDIDNCIVSDLT